MLGWKVNCYWCGVNPGKDIHKLGHMDCGWHNNSFERLVNVSYAYVPALRRKVAKKEKIKYYFYFIFLQLN